MTLLATGILMTTLLGTPYRVTEGYSLYRDLRYGPRNDAAEEGTAFKGERWLDHERRVYHTHRSGQFYDLLVPKRPLAGAAIFLYLHGGAWCQRYDKDGTAWGFVHDLASRGVPVATMDYQLQNDLTASLFVSPRPNATFADMLRDIDAMVSHLAGKGYSEILIGGESAGAHLSCLYAADEANPAPLGLNLSHALKIKLAVSIAGPLDLGDPQLVELLDGIWPSKATARKLFGALTGEAFNYWGFDRERTASALRRWSPASLVTSGMSPIALLYTRTAADAPTDGIVPVSNYETMRKKLAESGVRCAARLDVGLLHCQLNPEGNAWLVETVLKELEGK